MSNGTSGTKEKIVDKWPSLANAGFDGVHAVLSVGHHTAHSLSVPKFLYVGGIVRGQCDDSADPRPPLQSVGQRLRIPGDRVPDSCSRD